MPGCCLISVVLESASDRILTAMRKGHTLRDMAQLLNQGAVHFDHGFLKKLPRLLTPDIDAGVVGEPLVFLVIGPCQSVANPCLATSEPTGDAVLHLKSSLRGVSEFAILFDPQKTPKNFEFFRNFPTITPRGSLG